jgi:hypothetical protein
MSGTGDNQLIDVQWETTVSHRALLTRAQVRERLGYEVEQLQHQPIIDGDLYSGEPDMEGNLAGLADALGELETGPGTAECRTIRYVEPQ